jgi:hypothetical protein
MLPVRKREIKRMPASKYIELKRGTLPRKGIPMEILNPWTKITIKIPTAKVYKRLS